MKYGVFRYDSEKEKVKELGEKITAGLSEEQITKELSRRKKNKANKKYKAAQKAKKALIASQKAQKVMRGLKAFLRGREVDLDELEKNLLFR